MNVRPWVCSLVCFGLWGAGAAATEGQTGEGRFNIHVDGVLFQPAASGSVFDLAASELTLASKDYRHVRPSVEVSARVHPRVSVLAGWSTGSTEANSTSRQPLGGGSANQTTTFEVSDAFIGGLVLHVGTFGSGGQWRADVLGGAGRQSYVFRQVGTFPDASQTGTTLQGDFLTQGSGDLAFVGVRLDRSLSQRVGLSVSSRYQWSEAEVGGDFAGFAPISLDGLGLGMGIRLTP